MRPTKQFTFPLICILTFIVLIISSCKKEGLASDAIILDYGNPFADGCGWVIRLNGSDSLYSPKNLPQIYKQDSLKVHIIFHKLKTKYYCDATQIQLDAITKSQ